MKIEYNFDLDFVTRLSKEDAAYIAGLFDGEGCISASYGKKRGNIRFRCMIGMTNKDVIYWLHSKLNLTAKVIVEDRESNWKPCYRLELTGDNAIILLMQIKDYLIVKKQQAELGLELAYIQKHSIGSKRALPTRQLEILQELQDLNKTGRN